MKTQKIFFTNNFIKNLLEKQIVEIVAESYLRNQNLLKFYEENIKGKPERTLEEVIKFSGKKGE